METEQNLFRYERHPRAELGKGEETLRILRGPGRVGGLPRLGTILSLVSDSQRPGRDRGGGVGKKGQALLKARILRHHTLHLSAPPFLSQRHLHRPRCPSGFLCSILGTSGGLSHHTGISAHQTVRVYTHRNIVSTTKGEASCRVRAMEGKGRWGTGVRRQRSGREGGRRHSWSWDFPRVELGMKFVPSCWGSSCCVPPGQG